MPLLMSHISMSYKGLSLTSRPRFDEGIDFGLPSSREAQSPTSQSGASLSMLVDSGCGTSAIFLSDSMRGSTMVTVRTAPLLMFSSFSSTEELLKTKSPQDCPSECFLKAQALSESL